MQGCCSQQLFNIELEVLAREIRQEKEIKSTQIAKEEKLSLFAGNTILYIENPKDSIKYDRANRFIKIIGCKVCIKVSCISIY